MTDSCKSLRRNLCKTPTLHPRKVLAASGINRSLSASAWITWVNTLEGSTIRSTWRGSVSGETKDSFHKIFMALVGSCLAVWLIELEKLRSSVKTQSFGNMVRGISKTQQYAYKLRAGIGSILLYQKSARSLEVNACEQLGCEPLLGWVRQRLAWLHDTKVPFGQLYPPRCYILHAQLGMALWADDCVWLCMRFKTRNLPWSQMTLSVS